MASLIIEGDRLYYAIMDAGDGSAHLQLFKTQEALDLYLEDRDFCEDLSEGGSNIDQADINKALDVAGVIALRDE